MCVGVSEGGTEREVVNEQRNEYMKGSNQKRINNDLNNELRTYLETRLIWLLL